MQVCVWEGDFLQGEFVQVIPIRNPLSCLVSGGMIFGGDIVSGRMVSGHMMSGLTSSHSLALSSASSK